MANTTDLGKYLKKKLKIFLEKEGNKFWKKA